MVNVLMGTDTQVYFYMSKSHILFYIYAEKYNVFIFLGLSLSIYKLIWFLILRKELIFRCENKDVKG